MKYVVQFARRYSVTFLLPIAILFLMALAPLSAFASLLDIVGNVAYTYSGNFAVLTAAEIDNNSPLGSTSGTLRLELWASTSPYSGSASTGYKLAQYQMSPLAGGYVRTNVNSGSVPFVLPPNGTWYVFMLLTEYVGSGVNDGFATEDYVNFNNRLTVGAPPPDPVTSYLENPQPNSYQSGVGLISGWSCQGPQIGVSIDGGAIQSASYGTPRSDVTGVCGVLNTGFGLLVNYNSYGPGVHRAQLYVNGVAKGSPAFFTVTVPSGEFLTGVSSQVVVPNFPFPGRTATLIWQQATQNFAIKSVSP